MLPDPIPDVLHARLFFLHSLITLARFPGLPCCRTRCRISKTYVDLCMHHRCTRMCMCVLTDCKALACVTTEQQGWIPQGCTDYGPGNAAAAVGIQRQHRTLPSKTFSPKSLRGLLEAPHYRVMYSVTTELDANITDEVPSQPLGW